MMGPEEVLIENGEVSVNGQPVPADEPRLLHGENRSFGVARLLLQAG